MKVLLIGCGYAGKRHAVNIKELGHSVSVYDTDPETMAWVIQEGFEWVENTEGAYDGAVIATPPEFHPLSLNEVSHIKKVLIEKPLALTLHSIEDIVEAWPESERNLMMAHNYLFSPKLEEFRREVIRQLRSDMTWEYVSTDYLPHWHSPEFANDYKDRHEARDGCMAVSVSHQIYLLDHIFGQPDEEEYYKDNYDIIESRGDNAVNGIRSNKYAKVTTLESWVAKQGPRQHYLVNPMTGKGFDWTKVKSDTLASHKLIMKRFLDVIEGARAIPELCRLEEGLRIVKAIDDATYQENEYE